MNYLISMRFISPKERDVLTSILAFFVILTPVNNRSPLLFLLLYLSNRLFPFPSIYALIFLFICPSFASRLHLRKDGEPPLRFGLA